MNKTLFHPQVDGFAFLNNFSFESGDSQRLRDVFLQQLPDALAHVEAEFPRSDIRARATEELAIATRLERVAETFGLCAGMASAALDYFHEEWIAPRGSGAWDIPKRGPGPSGVLFKYLFLRQVESMSLNGLVFLHWMTVLHHVSPNLGGGSKWLLKRTRSELERIMRRLDAGKPTPIGLVGTTKNPFENHVVVAYDYQCRSGVDGHLGVLYVYDMNCPDEISHISLHESANGQELRGCSSCSPGYGDLRGIFDAHHSHRVPPVAVRLIDGLNPEGPLTRAPNETIPFSFGVRNVGYCPTSPLRLVLGWSPNKEGTVTPVQSSPTAMTLAAGEDARLAATANVGAEPGRRYYRTMAELSFQVEELEHKEKVVRVIPGLADGVRRRVEVRIRKPR